MNGDVWAADDETFIKTPSLVRVSKPPYFHDGSMQSLLDVVEFYNRGFLSKRSKSRRLDIDMRPLGLSDNEKRALVDFMESIPHQGVR